MNRRYRQHDVRRVIELDGVWDFTFLGEVDPETIELSALTFDDRMAVPGCWDATPAYAGRRGLAAYRTSVYLPAAGPYRLVFNGVNHWSQVMIGGALLATHSGGHTRFFADFASQAPGETDLVVLVDNAFHYGRSPLHHEYFDWYHYGGIARPVELHSLGTTWINAVRIATEDYQERRVNVRIDYGTLEYPEWADLTILFDGNTVLTEHVRLENSSGTFERAFAFPEAALWSPEAPNLHTLHVVLGGDYLRERFGIRQVQVSGQDILINGQAQRLLGFCRHESHPQFGCGLPDNLLVTDVQELRDMHANFVRGSHYPQDPRFLDLCDEAGICVWNEVTGWQHHSEHLTDPHFVQAQHINAAEMVAMSVNHPSVILYGLLNESLSNDPACRPGYESIIHVIRTIDPTRPVTYASNHPLDDVCLDLIDVVSVNTYPGWYFGSIEEIPEALDRIMTHVDSTSSAGKPVIISEIGAEGIYGWRDWNEARWSEQYQARLHETVIRHLFVDSNRACGLSLWVFGDFRTSEETGRAMRRGRGFNNKGVVDEYRRPKQSYEVARRMFGDLKKE